ncbi:hypothetical protein K438DRAFT_1969128 [Mycena galopus ATCC 62051]|nr:hypothetical protein K438DRAFT_1969128 [Mycena galopus ATCC 62051]
MRALQPNGRRKTLWRLRTKCRDYGMLNTFLAEPLIHFIRCVPRCETRRRMSARPHAYLRPPARFLTLLPSSSTKARLLVRAWNERAGVSRFRFHPHTYCIVSSMHRFPCQLRTSSFRCRLVRPQPSVVGSRDPGASEHTYQIYYAARAPGVETTPLYALDITTASIGGQSHTSTSPPLIALDLGSKYIHCGADCCAPRIPSRRAGEFARPHASLTFDRACTLSLLSTDDDAPFSSDGVFLATGGGGATGRISRPRYPPPPARIDEAIFTVAGLLRRQVKTRSGGQRRDGRVKVFLRVDLLAARAAVARRRRVGQEFDPWCACAWEKVEAAPETACEAPEDGAWDAVETSPSSVSCGSEITLEPHIVVVVRAGPRRRLVLDPEYRVRELRAQGRQDECARTNICYPPPSPSPPPRRADAAGVVPLVPSRQPRFARLASRRMPDSAAELPPRFPPRLILVSCRSMSASRAREGKASSSRLLFIGDRVYVARPFPICFIPHRILSGARLCLALVRGIRERASMWQISCAARPFSPSLRPSTLSKRRRPA